MFNLAEKYNKIFLDQRETCLLPSGKLHWKNKVQSGVNRMPSIFQEDKETGAGVAVTSNAPLTAVSSNAFVEGHRNTEKMQVSLYRQCCKHRFTPHFIE